MSDLQRSDDPNFAEIAARLWRGRRIILAAAAASALAALLWLRSVEPRYTAVMVVGPSVGALGADAVMLAASAGSQVRVTDDPAGGQTFTLYDRFIATVVGSPVADGLAADPTVMRTVFASAWDSVSGTWRPPDGTGSLVRRVFRRMAGMAAWSPPDAGQLTERLREDVQVLRVGETPLRRVVYRHPDRAFAMALLERLHRDADERLRTEAARRAGTQADVLRARIDGVTQEGHRRILTGMLHGYERVLLTIETGLPFAADIVEPPRAPNLPDWPNPVLVLPLAMALGIAAGAALAVAGHTGRFRRRRASRENGTVKPAKKSGA